MLYCESKHFRQIDRTAFYNCESSRVPYTPTHVVAVVPLWPLRRFLPFVALAIGSMVPDFPLFFPGIVDYAQTHSLVGAFTACLPIGASLFLLFELFMRRPLTSLLPDWVQRRLPSKSGIPVEPRISLHLRYFAGVAFAIVIGAWTHQIWDAFTHQGRWGTHLVPVLNSEIRIGGSLVPGYKLFQYGSTFFGLPLLTLLAAVELHRTTPEERGIATLHQKWKLLAALLILAVPIFVGAFAWSTSKNAYQALGVTIRHSGAIIMVGLAAYCILFHAFANGATIRRDI
jgi:hypothetical protein